MQLQGRLDLVFMGDEEASVRSQAGALFDPSDSIFKVLWERREDGSYWLRPIFGVNAVLGGNITSNMLQARMKAEAKDEKKQGEVDDEEPAAPENPRGKKKDPKVVNRSVYNWNEVGLCEAKKFETSLERETGGKLPSGTNQIEDVLLRILTNAQAAGDEKKTRKPQVKPIPRGWFVFLALGSYAEKVHNIPKCPLLSCKGEELDEAAYGRKRLSEEQKAFEKAERAAKLRKAAKTTTTTTALVAAASSAAPTSASPTTSTPTQVQVVPKSVLLGHKLLALDMKRKSQADQLKSLELAAKCPDPAVAAAVARDAYLLNGAMKTTEAEIDRIRKEIEQGDEKENPAPPPGLASPGTSDAAPSDSPVAVNANLAAAAFSPFLEIA